MIQSSFVDGMEFLVQCPICGNEFNPYKSALLTELKKVARDSGGAFRVKEAAKALSMDRVTLYRKLKPFFDHGILQRESPKSAIRFAQIA